ncbi:hypothetical protein [Robertkochia solimangrovi]|uniref:hypothetical protein n=1 Tax=Robertkochia solimangrovi TaxID=2213046 RepID=UPI00117CFB0F|nr:hypothetical protein [Robertkochia solimangrovi]TRZ44486.1 hypothetical protein DMZ48_08270 [Robertkochia solimangrovi]
MKVREIELKSSNLSNNCPECFSNDSLELRFYQKYIETPFFKRKTAEIREELTCHKCNTLIYPVRYTEDIERVRDFYFKTIANPKTSFRLTRLSMIILFAIVVAGIAAYLLLNNPELFSKAQP